jgi:hypothetical protein
MLGLVVWHKLHYTLKQGTLSEGKAQYSWPPCTDDFRSAAIDVINIMYFVKTSYFKEEVNRILPLPLVFPVSSISLHWKDVVSEKRSSLLTARQKVLYDWSLEGLFPLLKDVRLSGTDLAGILGSSSSDPKECPDPSPRPSWKQALPVNGSVSGPMTFRQRDILSMRQIYNIVWYVCNSNKRSYASVWYNFHHKN